MRRALIIGIDHYERAPLQGCVTDAARMHRLLSKNGFPEDQFSFQQIQNFQCTVLRSDQTAVTRELMEEKIRWFFSHKAESAVFYFSGHGSKDLLGGFLIAQDARLSNHGMGFHDIMTLAEKSPIPEIAIIADCCHSGQFANEENRTVPTANLREGITILTASGADEYAIGTSRGGKFTDILINALEGGAADLLGQVTVASLYHQADTLLTAWEQRPMLKAHVSHMSVLRYVEPRISYKAMSKITHLFPTPDHLIQLDKRYEPTEEPRDEALEADFELLQRFRALGLVEPIGHEHMYYAAMHNGSCRLTFLGKFYWQMVIKARN